MTLDLTTSVTTKVSDPPNERVHFWLWVMCLTGVDYFSTLGYQPSIAFEAAGRLAPLATVVLVVVTLTCALPVYCRVASASPHGQGSIAMLERLLTGWKSKLFVLVLLGFAATDFVITKTLSAADAVEHLVHNSLFAQGPAWLLDQLTLSMLLLVLLGGMFLRGVREVIIISVILVTAYLLLNAIVLGSGLWYIANHPQLLADWGSAVANGNWELEHPPLAGRSLWALPAVCLLLFPKLALGLSGFETGVAMMPLVSGGHGNASQRLDGRIRNTRRLLTSAAVIMSIMLVSAAMVTATLIPPFELKPGGAAANRALAWLAHGQSAELLCPLFGTTFGTIYDLATIAILWFAGASAMSGLLNLIPRYLPRYGMAPEWAAAIRPLVLFLTGVNLLVTWIFNADVVAQGGAYATGVMVLMSSASVAVVIDRWKASLPLKTDGSQPDRRTSTVPWRHIVPSVVFLYTTVAIIVEKPDGALISGCFIAAVILLSLASRVLRSIELRFVEFEHVSPSSKLLWDAIRHLEFPVLIPHRPGCRSLEDKEQRIRQHHRIDRNIPVVFIEASIGDASEFLHSPMMEFLQQDGRFVIILSRCSSIAHALASISIELAKTGQPPEIHFGWSEESPVRTNLKFLVFGEGNVPWLVHDLIRKAKLEPTKRPRVFIG